MIDFIFIKNSFILRNIILLAVLTFLCCFINLYLQKLLCTICYQTFYLLFCVSVYLLTFNFSMKLNSSLTLEHHSPSCVSSVVYQVFEWSNNQLNIVLTILKMFFQFLKKMLTHSNLLKSQNFLQRIWRSWRHLTLKLLVPGNQLWA